MGCITRWYGRCIYPGYAHPGGIYPGYAHPGGVYPGVYRCGIPGCVTGVVYPGVVGCTYPGGGGGVYIPGWWVYHGGYDSYERFKPVLRGLSWF